MADTTPIASPADEGNVTPLIRTEQYADIASFEDALNLIDEVFGGEIIGSDVLGDGFTVVENKATLLGAAMVILSVNFYIGDIRDDEGNAREFVSLRAVTKDGRKVIINDGGSGIYAQCKMLAEKRPESVGKPIMVAKGLRVSEYDHPTAGPSKTYYLDTSAA